ncbi:site-specific integrase [Aetokthonos hydrillicola Thurmond2011]|uniref:Site-specific integrase n=1 Tax=Aetokthonos hydrillicola Thurmond2011 TaxID=2712845 RepID=A0AAP5IFI0_9CYAN|nr:site-specific integrase [Aetokthonos hydrillicola]MBW4590123.1 site-specific integrase [Aetokthonos hydrillicola CCALA 1050]MDR9900646.1 site-specific integrase [Aetokthonos hydrillicola Thurmond2011]
MKIDRHGKAKVFSQAEIQRLFNAGLLTTRDKTLCAVMLYTGCRVNEAVTLKVTDVYDKKGRIRSELIIRKGNTKGKLATRTIPVLDDLRRFLEQYKPKNTLDGYLFPGRWGRGHLHVDFAGIILRRACEQADIVGASTHSFRRTALTQMSNAGIPLRIIQEISGHRNLDQLQKYLEVGQEQVRGAIASLSMLSPVSTESSTDAVNTSVETPT